MIRLLMMAVALLAAAAASSAEPKRSVDVLVRVDAMPFAWQHGGGAFRGFLVDLCREAVIRAGYLPVERPMTAETRAAILEGDAAVDFDLMCDPTTISLERLEQLAKRPPEELVFSPILFVANGTYVSRPADPRSFEGADAATARAGTFVGAVYASVAAAVGPQGTDAPVAPATVPVMPADCEPVRGEEQQVEHPTGYVIAGYIAGTTSKTVAVKAVNDPLDPVAGKDVWVCLRKFDDHKAAVKAICDERPEDRERTEDSKRAEDRSIDLYFGDSDIIAAYRPASCTLKAASRPLSYEPYAVLVSDRTDAFRAAFVRSLYELFSDGTVSKRFDTYFAGYSQSDPLKVLFRINSIPGLRN